MNLEYRTAAWWYWLATLLTLGAGLAGWPPGLRAAMLVTALHAVHFLVRGYAFTSFPLQVRLSYLALLVVGSWPPLVPLLWAMLIGTAARVLFAYCFLARTLSLMPWNRRGPLDWRRLWRTFTMAPTRGSFVEAIEPGTPGTISSGAER